MTGLANLRLPTRFDERPLYFESRLGCLDGSTDRNGSGLASLPGKQQYVFFTSKNDQLFGLSPIEALKIGLLDSVLVSADLFAATPPPPDVHAIKIYRPVGTSKASGRKKGRQ